MTRASSRGDSEDLRHDQFKKSERDLKQKIDALNSIIEDEKLKNVRSESLLQLRAELIKTMQDNDNVYRARVVLQLKEIEDLKVKLEKAKKFKASENEEYKNLFNSLQDIVIKNEQLKHELNGKNEKIIKYKNQLGMVHDEIHQN